jgi:tetratricopeptide (TPR) repeat protein
VRRERSFSIGQFTISTSRIDPGDIPELRERLRQNPDDAQARYALARNLAHHGGQEDAIAELRDALKRKPGDTLAHYLIGTLLEQLGRIQEAADEYRTAAELGCDQPRLYLRLGDVLYQQERQAEAREWWEKALELAVAEQQRLPYWARALVGLIGTPRLVRRRLSQCR